MTGPFPVIGIATKFTNAFRGCSYQANIPVSFVHVHDVLIAFKHAIHFSGQSVFFIQNFVGNCFVYIRQFSNLVRHN